MEKIPVEILTEILSYLPLSERDDKRRVNKTWRDIISLLPPSFVSEDQKKSLQKQILELGVMVYFSPYLVPIKYEEREFLVEIYEKGQLRESILLDVFQDGLIDVLTATNRTMSRISKIKTDSSLKYISKILTIFLMDYDDSNIHIGEIDKDQVSEKISVIKDLIKRNMFYFIRRQFHRIKKSEITAVMNDVNTLTILNEYKNTIENQITKITTKVPKYILRNEKLFLQYIHLII